MPLPRTAFLHKIETHPSSARSYSSPFTAVFSAPVSIRKSVKFLPLLPEKWSLPVLFSSVKIWTKLFMGALQMIELSILTGKLLIFIILFSAVIGAYCTTIDYRIRRELPLITRDCFCPSCGHRLAAIHQIPIISWIFLGGRCRYCEAPIPVRYPLIEAGFIFYYCSAFLLFQNRPLTYIFSWYLFFSIFLLLRSEKHWGGLLKGLAILSVYHIVFTALLLMILAAESVPIR